MKSILMSLLLLLVTACTDPIVMIPGGKLQGEVAAAPAAWESVQEVVQIEFRPDDPYSINIWAVVADSNLYIATRETRWVPMIEADSRVRVRTGNRVYELNAVAVEDDNEIESVGAAITAKYDYEISEEDRTSTRVFRLEPR